MRIALVTNNYTPYKTGVVNSLQALIPHLQAQGHEILLITLSFLPEHDDPPYVRRLQCPIKFKYYKKPMAIPWRAYHQMRALLNAFKPELIHTHHPFLLGDTAHTIAHESRLPLIFTYHSVYEAYAHYIPLPRYWVEQLITKRVLAFCKQVSHVIVPSTMLAQYLNTQGIAQPVSVIPSGLRTHFMHDHMPTKSVPADTVQLLTVGRFAKEKNMEAALELMTQLPLRYQLSLVGFGAQQEALEHHAYQKLGLSPERVRFIISPAQSQLLELYRAAHLFIFTSSSDTQGIVLAESLACATPVIALDGIGQRDAIINGMNGYIVDTICAMATCIESIVHDQTLAQLQYNAWRSAQRYQAQLLAQHVLAVYHQVIAR